MSRRFAAHAAMAVAVATAIAIALASSSARADDEDEPARFDPSSRGDRAAALERAEVVDLAAEVFGPDLAPYVASIAWCESTNRPGADTNWPYIGLLQVDPFIHAGRVGEVVGYPVTPTAAAELLRDPRVNVATAYLVWRDQGFGAWPVCSR